MSVRDLTSIQVVFSRGVVPLTSFNMPCCFCEEMGDDPDSRRAHCVRARSTFLKWMAEVTDATTCSVFQRPNLKFMTPEFLFDQVYVAAFCRNGESVGLQLTDGSKAVLVVDVDDETAPTRESAAPVIRKKYNKVCMLPTLRMYVDSKLAARSCCQPIVTPPVNFSEATCAGRLLHKVGHRTIERICVRCIVSRFGRSPANQGLLDVQCILPWQHCYRGPEQRN
jgi:hypothetical protein